MPAVCLTGLAYHQLLYNADQIGNYVMTNIVFSCYSTQVEFYLSFFLAGGSRGAVSGNGEHCVDVSYPQMACGGLVWVTA